MQAATIISVVIVTCSVNLTQYVKVIEYQRNVGSVGMQKDMYTTINMQ